MKFNLHVNILPFKSQMYINSQNVKAGMPLQIVVGKWKKLGDFNRKSTV